MKIGDKVSWKSQAGGSYSEKVGEIVAVIPKDQEYYKYQNMLLIKHNAKSAWGGGMARDHVSYAVLVPHPGKVKPTLYWPRVSGLKLIKEAA